MVTVIIGIVMDSVVMVIVDMVLVLGVVVVIVPPDLEEL